MNRPHDYPFSDILDASCMGLRQQRSRPWDLENGLHPDGWLFVAAGHR
jgi:hypothetical protein